MSRETGAPTACTGGVPTFWSPDHELHDPGTLPTPPGSEQHYYSEVPERGRVLLTAVGAADLGPVVEATIDDESVITAAEAVHDPELVTFLRTMHDRFRSAEGWPADRPVIPDTFPHSRDPSVERSTSLWAETGRRCADTSAPVFAGTWRAVLGSARAALAAGRHVADGGPAAYAMCRPPGHHAGRSRYGGFCYLNNAAIVAQQLTATRKRVAVVDIDLHHGNGTQDIFWDRADVLYASLHADPSYEYPYYAGFADETGGGQAAGATCNIPLPDGCEPAEYLQALGRVVEAVSRFGAQALVLSLGADTHANDPIGRFRLTDSTYIEIGTVLASLGLPTVVVQEGGYHLPSLGPAVTGVLRAWA